MRELAEHHYAVIMAGGSGTRMWPLSRKDSPKQFQALIGDDTMLQLMYGLLRRLLPVERIVVQTDRRFEETVRAQLPELPEENVLLEPEARDTAPAFGLAAAALLKRNSQARLGIFYSDHIIREPEGFYQAACAAYWESEAHPEAVTLIGATPVSPHTGLGWMRVGRDAEEAASHAVTQFIEKPDRATAEELLRSGDCLWNTGYKVCGAEHLLHLIRCFDPPMGSTLQEIAELLGTPGAAPQIAELYRRLPRISFEYWATERLKELRAVPADMGWTDVGDWLALFETMAELEGGSGGKGEARVSVDCDGCFVYGNGRMIATLGLKDLIIIDTADVVLVADKHQAQEIKKLIKLLEERESHSYL